MPRDNSNHGSEHQPRSTRRRVLTATGAGVAAGLAGCVGGGGQNQQDQQTQQPRQTATATQEPAGPIQAGDTGEEVHVLTDYTNSKWQDIWKEITPHAKNELGVNFKVEYAGMQGSGEQRLQTLIQSGSPPESYTSSPGMLGAMLGRGQLAEVNHIIDYLKAENSETVGESRNFDGSIFRVPHGKYTDTYHYRQDVLEKLGLEIPETYGQMIHNAEVIDDSDEVDIRGAAISGVKTGQSYSQFSALLHAQGAHYWKWDGDEPAVSFPETEVVSALEMAKEIAQYSPDPSSITWGPFLKMWAGGRIAQGYFLNGWAAGVAANSGNTEIAANTAITPLLEKEGTSPFAMGSPGFDGHPAINIADNVPGWFTVLKYMYEDPARAAPYYTAEPTRFVPAYEAVMEQDAYRNAEIFQEVPNLLELNTKARDEIAPLEASSEELVISAETTFAGRFPIASEMMNQVLVAGRDPANAWEDAHARYEKRLAQAKEKVKI